jgi:type III secretion system-like peptide-binding chaperone
LKLAAAAKEISSGLLDLTREGGPGNYMVVSAGDIYVQFAGSPGNREIVCESISNEYLPDELKVPAKGIKKLKSLGFTLTGDQIENFSRTYEIRTQKQARELAALTVQILEEVYGVPRSAEVHIEISLE